MRKLFFTVCNRSQLAHALSMAESMRKFHPDRTCILGWVDPAPLKDVPDWMEVVPVTSIEIPDWKSMTDRYYDFELVSACHPFFAKHILQSYTDCSELLYLSPTTWVISHLDPVVSSTAFFQLTPNRLQPITSGHSLADKHILNVGMFHHGSWILRPDGQQEHAFLNWWCKRTTDRAHFDLCSGMCLDQLWLNFLPIYHHSVEIIRHEGWHVGLHRLPGAMLTSTDSMYRINTSHILTIETAGISTYHPIWSDFQIVKKNNATWHQLLNAHHNQLNEHKSVISHPEAPFGKPAPIKSYRSLRKKGVKLLQQWVHKIETYNLTYN